MAKATPPLSPLQRTVTRLKIALWILAVICIVGGPVGGYFLYQAGKTAGIDQASAWSADIAVSFMASYTYAGVTQENWTYAEAIACAGKQRRYSRVLPSIHRIINVECRDHTKLTIDRQSQ